MLNAPLSLRLTLVEKLASMLDPGHLALTQIAQHLALLQNGSPPALCFPELPSKLPPCMSGFQPVVAGRKRH